MDWRVVRLVAAIFLTGIWFAGLPAWGDVAAPQMNWPDAQPPAVSWQGSWDQTIQSHLSQWPREFEELNEPDRQRRMRLREAHLLERLLALHREAASAHQLREARQRLATLYRALHRVDRETAMHEALAEDVGLALDDRLASVRRLAEIQIGTHSAYVYEDRRRLRRAAELADDLRASADSADQETARAVARQAWARLFDEARRSRDLALMDHAVVTLASLEMDERELGQLQARWLGALGLHELAAAELETIRETLDTEAAAALDEQLGWVAVPVPTARPQFRQQRAMDSERRSLWRRFVDQPQDLEPGAVASLLRLAGDAHVLHEVEPRRFEATWRRMVCRLQEDDGLRANVQAVLAQDTARAPTLAEGNKREAAVMARMRTDPWSMATHQTLLAEGERLLRLGHAERALRMFDDVHALAATATLQASADRGRRAVAQALQAGEGDVSPIPAQLERGAPTEPMLLKLPHALLWPVLAPFGSSADFRARVPHLPDGRWWLHADGSGVVAAGPVLVAGYRPGEHEPAWVHRAVEDVPRVPVASRQPEGWSGAAATAGRFEPAVDPERLILPWAAGAPDGTPRHLLALDRQDGAVLWSTAGHATWDGLQPVGNPVLMEGRVYVMAVRPASYASFHLFCLDARNGRTVWRRPLMDQSRQLAAAAGAGETDGPDVASYGGMVLAHRGSVYCLPNAGTVVRVDARDGMVEWASNYKRYGGEQVWQVAALRREVVLTASEGRLIVGPRDRASLMAFDLDSGRLAWETPGVEGGRLLARRGATLVLAGPRGLRGLDAGSGRLQWQRRFDQLDDVTVDPTGAVVAAMPGRLLRLSGRDGATLSEHALEAPTQFASLAATPDGGLVALSRAPQGVWSESETPTEPHLSEAWRHSHPTARLLQPHRDDPHPEQLFAYSALLLERLDSTAPDGVRWQRWLKMSPAAVHLHRDQLILQHDDQLTAIDRETGRQVWQVTAPYRTDELVVSADLLVTSINHPYWYAHMTGLDPQTGRPCWFLDLRAYPGEELRDLRPDTPMIDGDAVRLIGQAEWPHDEDRIDLMVSYRTADGAVAHTARLLPERVEHREPSHRVDDMLFFSHDAEQGQPVHALRLDGRERHFLGSRRIEGLNNDRPFTGEPSFHRIDAAPNWIEVRQGAWGNRDRPARWYLRRDDLAMPRTKWTHGTMVGDTLFKLDKDRAAPALHVFDMTSDPATQQTFALPTTEPYLPRHILSVSREGERAIIISTAQDRADWDAEEQRWEHHDDPPHCLRLDVIDLASGQTQASGILPDVGWHADITVRRVGPWLYVAGAHAIHRFHVSELVDGRAAPADVSGAGQSAATKR